MAVETQQQPEKPAAPAVHDIAGGWITEKAGTEVPAFLRIVYVVVAASAAAYLILYMYGEVNHSERGPLVKQFNLSTFTSEPLMYGIAVLVLLFFVGVSVYAAQKGHD
jgi:hypothetical protein